jgi:hypothetical protein
MSILRRLMEWAVPDWALRWGDSHTSWDTVHPHPVAHVRDKHIGWTPQDFHDASNSTTGRCPIHGTFGGSAATCRYPIDTSGTWCDHPLKWPPS